MKALSIAVLLVAGVSGSFGCSNAPPAAAPAAPTSLNATCVYSLSVADPVFTAAGGSGMATVTTAPGCRWVPSAGTNSWITFEATGPFVGPATIGVTVEPNRSFRARSALLEIADGQPSVPTAQTITQRGAGCLYSVEPTTLRREWLGTSDGSGVGAFSARVHAEPSDCRWTAAAGVSWMQFRWYSATSGTGDGEISLAILWNSSPQTRVGDVVVAGLSGVNPDAHLVVTQTGR